MGTSFSHALFPYTQRICLFNYLASATHSHALNLHNMQNLLFLGFLLYLQNFCVILLSKLMRFHNNMATMCQTMNI